MKIVSGILIALLIAAAAALVIQQRAQVGLRQENESLRQQLDQLARLQAENEQLSNTLAQAHASARGQNTELLRLRNELGKLRKQNAEIAGLQAKNQQLTAALASNHNVPPAKPPPETAPKINAPDNPAAAAKATDLGAIQLVNQTPNRFDLGGGKTCTLTPTIDTAGNYNIKVVFESKKTDGQTAQLETTTAEITTSPGRAVTLSVGDDNTIAFTPTVNPAP
jgi:hypothetical protein